MQKWKCSTRPRALALIMAMAAQIGCGDSKGSSSPPAAQSIGFDNVESDVAAVLLPSRSSGSTIVLLRGAGASTRHLVFVRGGVAFAEAIEAEDGRLGELSVDAHRFVFNNYTAASVTVTYYAPDGQAQTSQVELDDGAVGAVLSGAEKSGDDPTLAERVQQALEWFADPSNYHHPLKLYRQAGEKVAQTIESLREEARHAKERAKQLGAEVRNELTCVTQTRRRCAEQTAQQAPRLAQELKVIDPNGVTQAGFEVRDGEIRPKREEWEALIHDGTIPTEFTTTDVPCAESVFADMNPECPQYRPPQGEPGDAGSSFDAGPTGDAGNDRDAASQVDAGRDAAAAAGDGGPAACTSSSFPHSMYGYECPTWSEQLKYLGSGDKLFLRFHPSGGELRDQLSMTFDGDGVYDYGVYDYTYQDGKLSRMESLRFSIYGDGSHDTKTVSGTTTTTVSHNCTSSSVRHTSFSQVEGGATTTLYDFSDADASECPTLDEIKAFGLNVFPEVEMTMSFIQGSKTYALYLAQP